MDSIEQVRTTLERAQRYLDDLAVDQSSRSENKTCLTCMFFDEKTEQCTTYKVRPPARIIAYSCKSWKADIIPF